MGIPVSKTDLNYLEVIDYSLASYIRILDMQSVEALEKHVDVDDTVSHGQKIMTAHFKPKLRAPISNKSVSKRLKTAHRSHYSNI